MFVNFRNNLVISVCKKRFLMIQVLVVSGIDITTWTVSQKGERVTFSIWDFAGQTVYYNTHQVHFSSIVSEIQTVRLQFPFRFHIPVFVHVQKIKHLCYTIYVCLKKRDKRFIPDPMRVVD